MSRIGGVGGRWVVFVLGVAVLATGLWLMSRSSSIGEFDLRSTDPAGYAALGELLEGDDASVRQLAAATLPDDPSGWDDADLIVVARPDYLDPNEREQLEQLAADGATLVFGSPDRFEDDGDLLGIGGPFPIDARSLAETPAVPIDPGRCDISELVGLGPIDAAFTAPFAPAGEDRVCFADDFGTEIAVRRVGAGRIVTLSGPLLWANARLQPAKESGGEPLANGATAVAFAQEAARVVFIEPTPSPGAPVVGTQDPLDLLPFPVKLALVQLAAAFALFLWWRGRRLGRVPVENLPVEIAGSELVVAVGDLMRRRGGTRPAAVLRASTRRQLGDRLGVGPDPAPEMLLEVLALRTGRSAADLGPLLYDHLSPPVTSASALVTLARALDSLRQEVLHDHVSH